MKLSFPSLLLLALLAACSDKAPPTPVAAPAPAAPALAPSSHPGQPQFHAASPVRPASISATLKTTEHCSVDLVNDKIAQPANAAANKAQVHVHGWAADAAAGLTPREVFLEFEGASKWYAAALLGADRPDVANHFQKPALQRAGWNAYVNLAALPAASYAVHVIQVFSDGSASYCNTQRAINLAP